MFASQKKEKSISKNQPTSTKKRRLRKAIKRGLLGIGLLALVALVSFLIGNMLIFVLEVLLPNVNPILLGSLSLDTLLILGKASLFQFKLDAYMQLYLVVFVVLLYLVLKKIKPMTFRQRPRRNRGER